MIDIVFVNSLIFDVDIVGIGMWESERGEKSCTETRVSLYRYRSLF